MKRQEIQQRILGTVRKKLEKMEREGTAKR